MLYRLGTSNTYADVLGRQPLKPREDAITGDAVHTLLQHRIETPNLWNLWRCIDIYRYATNIRQLGSHYIILGVFKHSVTPPAFGRSNLKLLDSRGSSSVLSYVHTSWLILLGRKWVSMLWAFHSPSCEYSAYPLRTSGYMDGLLLGRNLCR